MWSGTHMTVLHIFSVIGKKGYDFMEKKEERQVREVYIPQSLAITTQCPSPGNIDTQRATFNSSISHRPILNRLHENT